MKKLWLVLLLSVQLLAFDTTTASKIFEKIFTAMLPQKTITVYTVNREYQKVVQLAPSLLLVKKHELANIVLVDSFNEIPEGNQNILFTTNSSVFERNEDAVGAFFWEYGRPKIIFLQSRLDSKNLTLSKAFQRYVVRELP